MPFRFLWVLVVLLSPLFAAAQSDNGQKNFDTGKKYYEAGQFSLAIQQFKEALSAGPAADFVADARFMLADAYLKQKQPDLAKTEFERVIQEFPHYPKGDLAWDFLAEAVLAQGRIQNAAEVLVQIQAKYPLSPLAPPSLLKSAGLFIRARKPEEARVQLLKLINEYPNAPENVTGQLILGDLLLAAGQEEAARLRFASVLVHPAGTEDQKNQATLRIAGIFLLQKDPQRAADLIKPLKLSADNRLLPLFEVISGQIQVLSSEWDKGIPLLESALSGGKLQPDEFTEAAVFLARTYTRINLFDKSRKWYEVLASRDLQPGFRVRVLSEGARVFSLMGNDTKAWDWCQLLLKENPGSLTPGALVTAAGIAVRGSRFSEAFRIYDEFINRFPDHPEADRVLLDAAENAWKNLGLKSTAAGYLKTVTARQPAGFLSDDAVYQLGLLDLEMGYTGDVNQLWDQFDSVYPGSEYGQKIRQVFDTLTVSLMTSTALANELVAMISDVNLTQSPGLLAYSLGKLVYKTGIRREVALMQLKNAAVSQDLSPEQREECYYMLASLAFQVQDFATSIRYITASQKEFPSGKKAGELTELNIRFLLLQAKPADFKTVESLAESLKDPAVAVKLKTELELKRYSSGDRETAVAHLKSLDKTTGQSAAGLPVKIALADLYSRQGDTLNAVQLWKELAAGTSRKEAELALRNLISWSSRRGNPTEWFQYLNDYLSRFTYSEYAMEVRKSWLKVALALGMSTQAGQWSSAFTRYDRLFDDDSQLYELAFYIRGKSIQVTDPASAMQAFRDYITRFPDGDYLAEAYSSLALLAKDAGDLEMAASYYKQANVFSFGETGSSLEIANLYFSNGDYKKAITEYSTLKETAGTRDILQIESRIIACYYRLANGVLAERMVKNFEKRNPPVDLMAEILVEKADFLIGQARFKEAIGGLDFLLDEYKASVWVPKALFKKAKALELDSKSEEAVPIYQSIMKNYPGTDIISDIYLSLGNYYFRKEAYDQAITNYKVICEQYKTPADRYQSALNNLIIAYEKYGFYDRALEELRVYIDRFPNDPEILDKKIKVGILLQKTKNFQQSVTYLSQLLQGTSGGLQAEITYNLGEAYYAKGDFLKAIDVFMSVETIKKANEKLDWITSSLYMTGQSYEKLGDVKSAIGIYEKISTRPGVDPVFKRAAQKEINRLKGR